MSGKLLHSRIDFIKKGSMMVGKDAVYVSTKVFIAELISLLIFSILRQLLLDSVIGEMHSPLSSHKRVLS